MPPRDGFQGCASVPRCKVRQGGRAIRPVSVTAIKAGAVSADTNATALDGVSQQIFSYTAHILTTQDTPAPGAYSDTIVIDNQF